MRIGLVIVVLMAVVATVVWYKQGPSEGATIGPAAVSSSSEKSLKPATRPSVDSRERPERNRTDRP